MGIDTLKFKGRIRDYDTDRFAFMGYKQDQDGQSLVSGTGSFHLGGYSGREVTLAIQLGAFGPSASIELSVPKALRGHNLHVATVTETLGLLHHLHRDAEGCVQWDEPLESMRLMRVDITRDFRLNSQAQLDAFVEGQRLLHPAYRPPVQAWEERSDYTDLRRGNPRRWAMSLYNKQVELASQGHNPTLGFQDRAKLEGLTREAKGVLRCELRLRRPVLKTTDITMVGDISSDRINHLHRYYFHRAGFGHEVGGPDKRKVAYMLASPEQQKALIPALGMLLVESWGIRPAVSRNTEAKHRKLLRNHGFSAADLTGAHESVRLEYDSGHLVSGPDGATAEVDLHPEPNMS